MSVYFVLSSGRCGTQWLTQHLSSLIGDDSASTRYWVTHEPLSLDYAPEYNTPEHPLKCNSELIVAHKDAIRAHVLDGGVYIECGFPCWRHLDWFKNCFKNICSVKVIYIHREPAANAVSLLKILSFVPPFIDNFPTKIPYQPGSNSHLPEYTENWGSLSPFEKNLVYWAEVQLQARAYKNDWNDCDWLTLVFDELFFMSTQNRVAEFLALDNHGLLSKVVDKFNVGLQCQVNVDEYDRHPTIRKIASSLGYIY